MKSSQAPKPPPVPVGWNWSPRDRARLAPLIFEHERGPGLGRRVFVVARACAGIPFGLAILAALWSLWVAVMAVACVVLALGMIAGAVSMALKFAAYAVCEGGKWAAEFLGRIAGWVGGRGV